MAYDDLSQFVADLEAAGELRRIGVPVDPVLEITEIADRVVKRGGPALLFEHPTGYDIPVLINAFGSWRRIKMALGADPDEVAAEIAELLKADPPTTLLDKVRMAPKLLRLASALPKTVRSAPCQEVVMNPPSLQALPILKCWPQDGGRFITLPLVFSHDPITGRRNVGMYRIQVFDDVTAGMHWQIHKVGARHYRDAERMGRRVEVAVALGGDPLVTYSATAPLPEEFDEMVFAGFLRRKPVEMVQCLTVNVQVPAGSDIVIEGYIDPEERRLEGPFGDHTGYYSLADMYPVLHVTCITHKRSPIYPATIVGRPPMEDGYLGKLTERLFLPLIRMQLPEIVDINLPVEGVFHNLAIVSIRKRYPGHAARVMHALWGLGQMSLTKIIVVVDAEVNVQDPAEVLWRVGNNIDPQRDTHFVRGPVDALDHASQFPCYGSKMGIDATRKWKEEGFTREWPDEITMAPEVKRRIDELWPELGL
jgi:4-hydroxy-3-polyprenylbenzoate decarboxylase